MRTSCFLGTGATIAQLRRKLHLQKALKAARLDRARSFPDLEHHIPPGYANTMLELDQDGQIEFLVLAVDFTERNDDWAKFDEYLVAEASPGLIMKICKNMFAGNVKSPVPQFDVHADIDDIG